MVILQLPDLPEFHMKHVRPSRLSSQMLTNPTEPQGCAVTPKPWTLQPRLGRNTRNLFVPNTQNQNQATLTQSPTYTLKPKPHDPHTETLRLKTLQTLKSSRPQNLRPRSPEPNTQGSV